MNKNLLKSKMALNGDTIVSLAEAIGVGRIPLGNKINGKVEFNRHEIASIAGKYNLTSDEVVSIFGLIEGE